MAYRVRPVRGSDFTSVYEMAKLTGGGFTNLPADRPALGVADRAALGVAPRPGVLVRTPNGRSTFQRALRPGPKR